MSKSHWSFSGRHWAGWTATWAGLILFVVNVSGAPDKRVALAGTAIPAHATAKTPAGSHISVETRGIDFGELPETAFGEYDPSRERR